MMNDKEQKNDIIIEELYNNLINIIHGYHPYSDVTLIDKAFILAKRAHSGQLRKSGEPYIIHPISVAIILAELKLDKETIIAALLHDVVEDTGITREELTVIFGEEIVFLVEGVTKLSQLSHQMSKKELKLESFRKLTLAMAEDIRVIIIKLADRLHNMRTLEYQPPAKQYEISRETMDIYSPIALRLGISVLKIELEDYSFKYLNPNEYKNIIEKIIVTENERKIFLDKIMSEINLGLQVAGINASINWVLKHLFSIYRKMVKRGQTLDEIYDLYTIKITVNSVKDCYIVLGILHDMYNPIPGRFKDYVSIPKENMYQSLHTTLISKDGSLFEVQIKTKAMDDSATYGILADWKYGEPVSGVKELSKSQKEKSNWLRQILEWQQDISDNNEFIDLVKDDFNLFSETIYCFTPKGEAITLPKGSSVIDFAYLIHSQVGNHALKAIVNGTDTELNYILNNGDRVKIITSPDSIGPDCEWIKYARTSNAKNKIKKWLKEEKEQEYIELGNKKLLRLLESAELDEETILSEKCKSALCLKHMVQSWKQLQFMFGIGDIDGKKLISELMDMNKGSRREEMVSQDINKSHLINHFSIKDKEHLCDERQEVCYRLAKCCTPVPEDTVVGVNSQKRGVIIHRKDCMNLAEIKRDYPERIMNVDWNDIPASSVYEARIKVMIKGGVSSAIEFWELLIKQNTIAKEFYYKKSNHDSVSVVVHIQVQKLTDLNKRIAEIKEQEYVLSVERKTDDY